MHPSSKPKSRRLPAQEGVPLFLFDAGCNSVALAEGLGDTPVAILLRLRCDRCFYGDPPPSKGKGRPFRHGAIMAFKDQSTWPEPTEEHTEQDQQYGTVRVTRRAASPRRRLRA